MRRITVLLALICVPVALVSAGAVRAGQPTCTGAKIDPVASGTYAVPFGTTIGSIAITVRQTDAGDVFDFQTRLGIASRHHGRGQGRPCPPGALRATGVVRHRSAFGVQPEQRQVLSYLCFQTTDTGGGE